MPITAKTKKVTFSDGSSLTVSQSTWDISMNLKRMEDEALASPSDDENIQLFRVAFYPKLAACVVAGQVPTEQEARKMPEDDLDIWYAAVKELNPRWFAPMETATDNTDTEDKKKGSGGG